MFSLIHLKGLQNGSFISVIASFFLSLLYSYPFFGAPTAPRAFELLARFKRSQFGTDLRQCSCFSDSVSIFLSLYHAFYSVYFPINLNGEMLIDENESHDYSSRCARGNTHLSLLER